MKLFAQAAYNMKDNDCKRQNRRSVLRENAEEESRDILPKVKKC